MMKGWKGWKVEKMIEMGEKGERVKKLVRVSIAAAVFKMPRGMFVFYVCIYNKKHILIF